MADYIPGVTVANGYQGMLPEWQELFDMAARRRAAIPANAGELRGTGPGESRDPRAVAASGFAGGLEDRIAQGVFEGSPLSAPVAAGMLGSYARTGYDALSGENGSMNTAGGDAMGLAAAIAALATKNPTLAKIVGGGAVGGLAGAGLGIEQGGNPYAYGALGAVAGMVPGAYSPAIAEAKRLGTEYTDDVSRGINQAGAADDFKSAPGTVPNGALQDYRPQRTDYWGDTVEWGPREDYGFERLSYGLGQPGLDELWKSRNALLEAERNPGVRPVKGAQGFPTKDEEVLMRQALAERALYGRVTPGTLASMRAFGLAEKSDTTLPRYLEQNIGPLPGYSPGERKSLPMAKKRP